MFRSAPVGLAVLLFLTVGAERAHLRADLPTRSDRVVNYTIRAMLKPSLKEVHADMDLVWRNTSGQAVNELYFHLYLNAFASRDTTYTRESEGSGKAGAEFDDEYPGWVRIDAMRLPDGTDLWTDATRSFVSPDDGNEKDHTLAHVTLPSAVAPGETLSLKIDFRSRLPRVLHRTGWAGDPDDPTDLFFMVAQWFPKVAVLRRTADGKARWNAHQFHRNTEFFSDYGVYDVSLTVPQGYVVGATGKRVPAKRVSTTQDEETVTYRHRQLDVHDFAWTASPHFVEKKYTWSFDEFCDQAPAGMGPRIRELLQRTAEHLGVTPESIKPRQKVEVHLLYQRDHGGVADRFWQAAGASLACYGIWFGQYPYEVLTIVDPPAGGGAAGGMEYPTLITVFGDRHAPDYAVGMEGVTIHEFGHQYFYGLIGSNEFEEAWLDEGFTSFTDARVYDVAYGKQRTRLRYGPVHQPYHRPFDAPSVFGRLRGFSRLEGWLSELPRPWKRPASLLPPVPALGSQRLARRERRRHGDGELGLRPARRLPHQRVPQADGLSVLPARADGRGGVRPRDVRLRLQAPLPAPDDRRFHRRRARGDGRGRAGARRRFRGRDGRDGDAPRRRRARGVSAQGRPAVGVDHPGAAAR
ncbi:MAG: M1 family metallopeptidase [Planctomycetota bacterium]